MMKRQSPYGDSTNINNPYAAPPPPHLSSAQRVQHGGGGGISGFSSRPESYPADPAEHTYKSSKLEGQWQWDRDAQNAANQAPPHAYSEGQGGNVTRSYYQGLTTEPKLGFDNLSSKEARTQPHEQDMEIGYEDNSTLPMTFEGLERKFLDDVMKLAKEQSDAEDAENARHREKIIEINARYLEKLSGLRAQQANRREEFLLKESQARLSKYQQAGISHYQHTGLQDARGYGSVAVAGAAGEVHRPYAADQYESYRDRPTFVGSARTQGTKARVPYPEGRVYNNSGSRYY